MVDRAYCLAQENPREQESLHQRSKNTKKQKEIRTDDYKNKYKHQCGLSQMDIADEGLFFSRVTKENACFLLERKLLLCKYVLCNNKLSLSCQNLLNTLKWRA